MRLKYLLSRVIYLFLSTIKNIILNRKIKLIWDFKGPDGLETAKHHCVHLKEFAAIESLAYHEVDLTKLNEMHTIAFITVNEVDMKTFRNALKPHRGVVVS